MPEKLTETSFLVYTGFGRPFSATLEVSFYTSHVILEWNNLDCLTT